MKLQKSIFFILTLFLSLNCYSQIQFSKGYFVTDKGVKTACLIKNVDWLYSPKSIQYKLDESAAVENISIDSIKEFSIDNFSRYIKVTVKIDRSPAKLNMLNYQKQPQWSEETLLLKELVCGKAGLWVYIGVDREWYFYTIDNSLPEQLIYKEYLVEGLVRKNATFRQQLNVAVQNDETKKIDVSELDYDKKSLTEYFKLYNSKSEYCVSPDFKKPEREIFNVKIAGYVNYSTMAVTNSTTDTEPFKFDSKFNWMGGIELEYFLPFNRNVWSIIFTPVYEHIYYDKTVDFKLGNVLIKSESRNFDIQSIDLSMGGRHTRYLNKDSKFYFDFMYSPLALMLKGSFKYNERFLDVNEGSNFIVGAGYGYKNWGVGLKYHSSKNLLNKYGSWLTNYPKVSLSVTYKLYKMNGQ